MSVVPGTRLGPYEITAKLGEGGMGEVYRARDSRLGREVAVKVLPQEVAGDPERLRRFEQEARAASALNHPGILTVHDFGNEGDVAYLVTELLEGESLRERLRRGAIPEREALALAAEIARALAVAHGKGIVHRDLKPENLFLTRDGRIKILDFGLARWTPPVGPGGELGDATTIAGLTEAGMVLGTVGYMAPEQARGIPADARADLFALGCVLYEMLAGQRAFDRASAIDTLAAILHEDPLAAPASDGGLPEELVRVLRHCLEKDPTRRFQTASDVAFALDSLREGSRPSGSAPALVPVDAKRRWLLPAAVGVVFVAAALAVVLLRGRGSPTSSAPPRVSSIVVLPFVNTGGTADLDYLGDGIAESLIGKLSPLPGLKVLARSTAFHYRGPKVDPLQTGRELKVGAVLSGQVDQRDGRLVIGAELVDVASGAQLWGDRFNRGAEDLFAIEEEVARQIADRLSVRLGSEQAKRLASQPTENSEAYRLYLQGRYSWYQRTFKGVRKSLELFQQAVALDPKFALAWTGVADAYIVGWASYLDLPQAEAYRLGKVAAERAIELDPELAEAHASLAPVLFENGWDWAAAEREYRRSLELNPGYASAHQGYGEFLYCMRRFDESLAEIHRAIELDPGAAIAQSVLGWSLLAKGDTEAAITQIDSTLRMQPDLFDALIARAGAVYLAHRSDREIVDAFLAMDREAGGLDAEHEATLRRVFEKEGIRGFWRALLRVQLETSEKAFYASPILVQWSYAMLGEKEKAIDILEQMVRDRDPGMTYLANGYYFAPLRGEPRFEALVASMKFPAPSHR
jgi:serine/threonine-protein kinase